MKDESKKGLAQVALLLAETAVAYSKMVEHYERAAAACRSFDLDVVMESVDATEGVLAGLGLARAAENAFFASFKAFDPDAFTEARQVFLRRKHRELADEILAKGGADALRHRRDQHAADCTELGCPIVGVYEERLAAYTPTH